MMELVLDAVFWIVMVISAHYASYSITRCASKAYFRSKLEFLHELAHHDRLQSEPDKLGIKA